jgi:hypothetical protein
MIMFFFIRYGGDGHFLVGYDDGDITAHFPPVDNPVDGLGYNPFLDNPYLHLMTWAGIRDSYQTSDHF